MPENEDHHTDGPASFHHKFLGDVASELLYPIMPLYLKSIGMGALYIGLLEGVATPSQDCLKLFWQAFRRKWKKNAFVWSGYVLSSLSKSAIGLFASPIWFF